MMFKADIIQDRKYFQFQHFQLIVVSLTIIPLGLLSNSIFGLPEWISIPAGILYVVLMIFVFKNQKKIQKVLGKKHLEANADSIAIYSKKDGLIEQYSISAINKIKVQKNLQLETGGFKDVIEQFKGNFPESNLKFRINNETKHFDFIIDTHYQLIQLEKCIKAWEEKNIEVSVFN